MKYVISACLCGVDCKYDGKNNLHPIAKKLCDSGKAIPVCPEELGGLSTPRIPSEIVGNLVLSRDGINVTKEFETGSKQALDIAKENDVTLAIFQKRSPSCGVHQIYDGSFTNTLIEGQGKTTQLFRENGIEVITIDEFVDGDYEG